MASTPLTETKDTGQTSHVSGGRGTAVVRLAGKIFSLLTCRPCRRRAPRQVATETSTEGYEALRKVGQELSDAEKAEFATMAWWTHTKTKMGARVFVLAPRGQNGDIECFIDMWKLLAYTVDQMHRQVVDLNQMYAVVWTQFSDHRVLPFTALGFKRLLPQKYANRLEAVHVVHPSWTVRVLRLVLWPIASDEFWDHFQCHERIEFLDSSIILKTLPLPKDIIEYDKWLDKQAEEMSKQAGKQMNSGGFGASMFAGNMENDADTKNHQEQMDRLKHLLEEKGYGKKTE